MKVKVEAYFPSVKVNMTRFDIEVPDGLVGQEIDSWIVNNKKKIFEAQGIKNELIESWIKRYDATIRRV